MEDKEVHIDVFDDEYEELLKTPPNHGLTDEMVKERLQRFGRNGN